MSSPLVTPDATPVAVPVAPAAPAAPVAPTGPVVSGAFRPQEPIPGYHVESRLGAGGYGEVWRAIAPGQIAKAIKIVYGYRDDQRAARELAALNRIKAVRHPFLLSLERIELVDGHLVIVTELADSSLRNLFDDCRAGGGPGIPRETLLLHLRDVADALDYINQEHSLQHLDVKPENLLLVGGRVKVADFGLVKDLEDVQCSMVGGLTPSYAAPELFDGRPSSQSDQYSLAIVYQELLTGVMPFEGRTTAQLASQHLHGRPRVDVLPTADQLAVTRALAKEPGQRFASCRELIDRLLDPAAGYRPRPVAAALSPSAPSDGAHKTEVLAPELVVARAAAAEALAPARARQPDTPAETHDLPPLPSPAEPLSYSPTVVIGLGGLAAETLLAFERRLLDRWGGSRNLPAVQLLLFDTDAETLRRATEAGRAAPLENDATLLLPLRAPAEYRRETTAQLPWLSRRWIFNIPRSLETEGFRPLGRLALADHRDRVTERLARALRAATDEAALEHSRERSGLNFVAGPPRVFVVASLSGGTGSGMVLDVGYLVRKLLAAAGYGEVPVCGVLAHCAGRNARARELAVANSYSCLVELGHYTRSRNGYPGDPSLGLEKFPPRTPPFSTSYVVQLGEELDPDGFVAGAERLAEYLYLNALTPAAARFEQSRGADPGGSPADPDEPVVRTFGLGHVGVAAGSIPREVVDATCESLLERWKAPVSDQPEPTAVSLTDPNALLKPQFAAGLSDEELRQAAIAQCTATALELDALAPRLHTLAAGELGSDPARYLQAVLEELAANFQQRSGATGQLPGAELILETLDSLITADPQASAARVCLESVVEAHLQRLALEQGAALQSWVQGLIASPRHRVRGALRAADCLTQHLRQLGRQAQEILAQTRQARQLLEKQLREAAQAGRPWLRYRGLAWSRRLAPDPRLVQLFEVKIEELAINSVSRLTSLVTAHLAVTDDRLRNLSADLDRLSEEFRRGAQPTVAGTGRETVILGAAAPVAVGGPTTPERRGTGIDRRELDALEAGLAAELEGLLAREPGYVRMGLPRVLRQAVRAALLGSIKEQALAALLDPAAAATLAVESLAATAHEALPQLAGCGGQRQMLLVAPVEVLKLPAVDQPLGEFTQPVTAVAHDEADVVLCCETGQVGLRRAASAVLAGRFQQVEAASRLHTRIDVTWLPL